jgi:putative ABC transport system permease protein
MPDWKPEILRRLAPLKLAPTREAEIADELSQHLDDRYQELVSSGQSEDAAFRSSLGELKDEDLLARSLQRVEKNFYREPIVPGKDSTNFFSGVLQDIRFALRMLRKSPGFTAVAVLMLALGIGANTAIFSMVNGILLRALPYAQPAQLYAIHEFVPQWAADPSLEANGGNFLAWRRDSHAFSGMTLIDSADGSLLGMGHPQWLYGAAVTSEFFSILGVQPQMGRAFLPGDGANGGKPEIILTHELWREQFHSDPGILGKEVNLGGRGLTVIGVMPANFIFPRVFAHNPQYFVPFPWKPWNSRPGIGNHCCFAIGKLKEGVTPREAEAQLDVTEARIALGDKNYSKFNLFAFLTPLKTEIVGSMQKSLWMLTLAAGLVLLIVCANLANMLLVKNAKRMREIGLRSVFGASQWRLARQFVTETLVLALAGGCLGLLLAKGALWLLVRNAPVAIPRVNQIHLDSTVLWFTLAVTILAALVFGLLPSFRATEVPLAECLKSAGPTASASKQGARLRSVLVIGEVALCAALLPACLLLIESLRNVDLANQWMNEEHVITADLLVHVPLGANPTPKDIQRAEQERNSTLSSIEEKVRELPGVESAGLTNTVPLQAGGWGDLIDFRETTLPVAEQPSGQFRFVTPGYFQAIGLPLVKGRFLLPEDRGQSVAVVSQSVAQKLLGGRSPLGMHVYSGDFSSGTEKWCRVVGVVGDVRAKSDHAPILAVYFPLWLFPGVPETLVVRTKMNPAAAAGAIRQTIWSVDPDLAIPEEKTLKTILASAEAPRRYDTSLVTLFAVCAVLLAMLGLSAVISYSVSQRTHEIGIRMALGAQRADVLRMVVREGALLAGVGTAAGIGGGFALTRFLQSLLFEIKPTDPVTFIGVAIVLVSVALLACYVPARRATRVDPMVALRYE